jgi:hypothetical protein
MNKYDKDSTTRCFCNTKTGVRCIRCKLRDRHKYAFYKSLQKFRQVYKELSK